MFLRCTRTKDFIMRRVITVLFMVTFVGFLYAQVPPVKTDKVKAPVKREVSKVSTPTEKTPAGKNQKSGDKKVQAKK